MRFAAISIVVLCLAVPAQAQVTGTQQTVVTCPQSVAVTAMASTLPSGWSAVEQMNTVYRAHHAAAGHLFCDYALVGATGVEEGNRFEIGGAAPAGMTCTADGGSGFVCRSPSDFTTHRP